MSVAQVTDLHQVDINARGPGWINFSTPEHPASLGFKHCGAKGSSYPFHMVILNHSPVHSDPHVLGGTLVFRNTRVIAQTLLDYVAAGDALDLFLEHFPTVNREDAVEFLKLAREDDHS